MLDLLYNKKNLNRTAVYKYSIDIMIEFFWIVDPTQTNQTMNGKRLKSSEKEKRRKEKWTKAEKITLDLDAEERER